MLCQKVLHGHGSLEYSAENHCSGEIPKGYHYSKDIEKSHPRLLNFVELYLFKTYLTTDIVFYFKHILTFHKLETLPKRK